MEHHTTTSRAEAERLLGIAEKLLRSKDFNGSRDFAILAQETEPLLDGSDQILAVAEVLLASSSNNNKNKKEDWYSILQIPQVSKNDDVLIKKQYRRLALLLHPDKNKFAFADSAFRLVADAWAVLSDPSKKSTYDNESGSRFQKVDLFSNKRQSSSSAAKKDVSSNRKLPVRRGGNANNVVVGSFWTACPYCYNLYEFSREYEGCCLRCESQGCRKAFTAAEILSMPPVVPGKEAYYCCWGVFPMGFRAEGGGGSGSGDHHGFPKWMPPMFGDVGAAPPMPQETPPPPPVAAVVTPTNVGSTEKKKRGRPRKNY